MTRLFSMFFNDCHKLRPLVATHLDVGERVALFLLEVFLKVEERVEEVRGEFARLEVTQGHAPRGRGSHHVEHLKVGGLSQKMSHILIIPSRRFLFTIIFLEMIEFIVVRFMKNKDKEICSKHMYVVSIIICSINKI